MAEVVTLRCPCCAYDHKPEKLGLAPDGHFDAENARPNELAMLVRQFGGRGRIACTVVAVPRHYALGIREMLRARLARVEQELREAGVVLDD